MAAPAADANAPRAEAGSAADAPASGAAADAPANDAAHADVASAPPLPTDAVPAAVGAASPAGTGERTPLVLQYRADLGLDVGADTFLFHHGQTAFELEVSPRVSYVWSTGIEAGVYAAAGYGGPIPAWSQLTMFGIGPFVGYGLPLWRNVSFRPWLGVAYHYAFIEGYTGFTDAQQLVPFPQQSVRVDVHGDVGFAMSRYTELTCGVFVKTRLAPIDEGPGTAAQVAYGLRLSATSAF